VDYGRSSDNTDKKMSLLCNRKGLIFKVESNENGWASRRWQIFQIGFELWQSRFIWNLNLQFSFKIHISFPGLYGSTTRHFLTNREHRIISRNWGWDLASGGWDLANEDEI
jgi:hypothetical protein